jgi:hypothetical protein
MDGAVERPHKGVWENSTALQNVDVGFINSAMVKP